MFWGTVQPWPSDVRFWATEKAAPPTISWQERPVKSLFWTAGEESWSWVPAEAPAALATFRGWLPVMPVSQPEMKGPAIARTCWGEKGMSNAWGIAEPVPERTLRMLW